MNLPLEKMLETVENTQIISSTMKIDLSRGNVCLMSSGKYSITYIIIHIVFFKTKRDASL